MTTDQLHDKIARLEAELAATRAKDTFWANTAHELRTPLNAVIGLSHLLVQSDLDEKQYRYLSKIQNAADMMLGIVNDILDYAKIEAGRLEIESIDFNINAVLDNVTSMIAERAIEKGLELIFDVDNEVPAVLQGDSLRLSQVLINLLTNAVKFTKSGEIVLRVTREAPIDGETVIGFEICDTGIGMTPKQLANLFQAFSQADRSTARLYGGTGLGLTISKQLVEMMGGTIGVSSAFGEGSCFHFTVRAGKEQQKERRSYRLPSRELMKKRVLIADPNPRTAHALSRMLSYYRYNAIIANATRSLTELLSEDAFDLIFIDQALLGHSDPETFNVRGARLVLLVSGEAEPASQIPAAVQLRKPFNHQTVFSTILKIYNSGWDVPRESTVIPSQRLSGKRILLAEDNEVNQIVLIGLLENSGVDLTIASDGGEVLSLIEQESFDLVLMDVHMPVMDGYGVARRIRQVHTARDLPIIALSANFMPEDIERAHESGMQDYLTKPIDVKSFYRKLGIFLGLETEPAPKVSEDTAGEPIAELDVAGALARTGGSQTIFQRALERFETQIRGAEQRFTGLLATHCQAEAAALIHDIKGSAGNVGAHHVAAAAAAIERTMQQEQPVTAEMTAHFAESLHRLLDYLETQRTHEATPHEHKPELTPLLMQTLLEQLRTCARANKARPCKETAESLEAYRWPRDHAPALEAVCNAVRSYRFKEVMQLIDTRFAPA